jgi:hypothetical protein
MADTPLRLVVFDCDGTLVDSGHIIVAAMRAAWAAEGLAEPEDPLIRRQVGLPLVEAIGNVAHEHDADMHHRLAEHYKQVFVTGRIEGLHDEPLYPGCREVLDALAGEGAILAVATGKGRRGLMSTLERHGIGPARRRWGSVGGITRRMNCGAPVHMRWPMPSRMCRACCVAFGETDDATRVEDPDRRAGGAGGDRGRCRRLRLQHRRQCL